ncbi:MAG: hypothetical protein ACK4PI_13180 [Tepidisphaerales bacterium]
MKRPRLPTRLLGLGLLTTLAAGGCAASRPVQDRVYTDHANAPSAAVAALAFPLPTTPPEAAFFLDRTAREPVANGGFISLQSVTYTVQEDRQLGIPLGGIRRPRTGGLIDRTAYTQTIITQQR